MIDLETYDGMKMKLWWKLMAFVSEIYRVTNMFPASGVNGLSLSMQKGAATVPKIVAEGYCRTDEGEFLSCLRRVADSLDDVRSMLETSLRLEYIGYRDYEHVTGLMAGIDGMLKILTKQRLVKLSA